MRFKRIELSPANKKQYLIALGVKDLELLIDEARNAYRYTPVKPENKQHRQRLKGIVRGLEEALETALQDGDEGERLPIEERQKYKNEKEKNPLLDITRLEIVDWTKEVEKGGGRTVIFWDEKKKIFSSIQDEGRTLKIFIEKREQDES